MTSKVINYSQKIDVTFPVSGVDNPSTGFHNNFYQIKLGLDTLADEITEQQSRYAELSGFFGLSALATKVDTVNGIVPLHQLPSASTTMSGVTMLLNTVNSTSTNNPTTAKSLSLIYDNLSASLPGKVTLSAGKVQASQLPIGSITTAGIIAFANTYANTSTSLVPSSAVVNDFYNSAVSSLSTKVDLVNGMVPSSELTLATTTTLGTIRLIDTYIGSSVTLVPSSTAIGNLVVSVNDQLSTKADLVGGKVSTQQLPAASTTTAGITQLSNSSSSTSLTTAPTSYALNKVYAAASSAGATSSYAVDVGAVNAYTGNYSPPITAIADGFILKFKAASDNTGPSTFSPNSVPAAPIVTKFYHKPLTGKEITKNGDVWVQWNSSINGSGAWVLMESTGAVPAERVYTTSTTNISISNGSIQNITMATSGALTLDLADGQSLLMMIQTNGYSLDVSAHNTPAGFALDAGNINAVMAMNIASKIYLAKSGSYVPLWGSVWSWGMNGYGQLGNGNYVSKSSPIQVLLGGTSWSQVSSGAYHTGVINIDGSMMLWGRNNSGQIGDGTTGNIKTSPVQTIAGGTVWKQMAAGNGHTAAIKSDGTLWLWGQNNSGQLGDNTTIDKLSPVQTVAGGTNWKQVAVGLLHTAAIKTDGTLWLWGFNYQYQLGDGTRVARSSPVQTIAAGSNWKQVACGGPHTAAIKTDGTLWLWGGDTYGQLGDGASGAGLYRSSPVQTVSSGTNWAQVSCGYRHTTAIKTDGTLWAWGHNYAGQLGDNTTTNRSSPVQTIAGGTNWKQMSNGTAHCAMIKSDGTLWTWGRNNYGQLGDNTTNDRSSPIQTVSGGNNWKQVASGNSSTYGIR